MNIRTSMLPGLAGTCVLGALAAFAATDTGFITDPGQADRSVASKTSDEATCVHASGACGRLEAADIEARFRSLWESEGGSINSYEPRGLYIILK